MQSKWLTKAQAKRLARSGISMGHLKTVILRAGDEGLRAVIKERGGGKYEKAATEIAAQLS